MRLDVLDVDRALDRLHAVYVPGEAQEVWVVGETLEVRLEVGLVDLAAGEAVIKCPSSLTVRKATHDHSCY
jgi:hypothetical protein